MLVCFRGVFQGTSKEEGALTWRQLARKSFRSSAADSHEDDCQPEPIPQLLVTADGEQIAVTPQALRLWDRLLLEPFSQTKDVVYVALIPDNSFVYDRAAVYFRELSKTYENYRFGKHVPCPFEPLLYDDSKPLMRNGLLKVGTKGLMRKCHAELDVWFKWKIQDLEAEGRRALADQLRSYALICKEVLAKMLHAGKVYDRQRVFNTPAPSSGGQAAKENQQPATPVNSGDMPPPKTPDDGNNTPAGAAPPEEHPSSAATANGDGEASNLHHTVVIYVVSPFLDGQEQRLARLVSEGLLRAYLLFVDNVPELWRQQVQLEIVGLSSMLQCVAAMPGVTFEDDPAAAFVLDDNG